MIEVAGCLWLTSDVVDGSAVERRGRRVERRALDCGGSVSVRGDGDPCEHFYVRQFKRRDDRRAAAVLTC